MSRAFQISVLLLCVSCLSNQRGASNPNSTLDEFKSPTGTLSDSNVQSVLQAAILGTQVSPFLVPDSLVQEADIKGCTDSLASRTSIRWDCALDSVSSCTGKGTTETSTPDDLDIDIFAYTDVSLDCSEPSTLLKAVGEVNVSTLDDSLFCADILFTNGEADGEFNGCQNESGDFSVRLSGDNFVVSDLTVNPACTEFAATVRDRSKKQSVVCAIDKATSSCDSVDDVLKISNCTF